jgi:hypothetical protein
MCKADLDQNIMAQQTCNNEMWVVKGLDIGPQVNPQWYFNLFERGFFHCLYLV